MMFGTPLYMLHLNRDTDPGHIIIDETFGNFWPVNVAYNQYMLLVGNFDTENFKD